MRQTYGAGRYRPYEELVRASAEIAGVGSAAVERLFREWGSIEPWPETREVLTELGRRVPLAVITNCSARLAPAAVSYLQLDLFPRSLLVHAFHTFPENCAVVKTQTLIELPEAK